MAVANSTNARHLRQRRSIASGAFISRVQAAPVNFADYDDFLDSAEFSDDNVNQLGIEVGN
ncbi:MAG: hypothetical protein ABI614_03440 [Planctomycetota bacterium]